MTIPGSWEGGLVNCYIDLTPTTNILWKRMYTIKAYCLYKVYSTSIVAITSPQAIMSSMLNISLESLLWTSVKQSTVLVDSRLEV